MSYPQCDAPAALLAAANVRAWSGVAIFKRGAGADVSMPTFSTLGAGVYTDALDLLNGRGVGAAEAWPAFIAAAWTAAGAAGTATIEIDETTGRLAIETSAEDFTITGDASLAALGFDTAGHGLVGGVAPFRRVAPAPFELGALQDLEIEIEAAAGGVLNVFEDRLHQDVITAMRAQGSGDADDRAATTSLQYLDASTYGLTVRWTLDEHGHVKIARVTASTDALAWLDTDFRDRLGFSGSETETTSGAISILRADHPMPGVIVFPDGLDADVAGHKEISGAAELVGPGAVGIKVGDRYMTKIEAHVTGPAAARDIAEHYRRRFRPYVPRGALVSLYRMWGDPRRRLRAYEVTATQPAHGLVYTTEADSYRGRQDGHRAAADTDEISVEYDSGVMQQARIAMMLREA